MVAAARINAPPVFWRAPSASDSHARGRRATVLPSHRRRSWFTPTSHPTHEPDTGAPRRASGQEVSDDRARPGHRRHIGRYRLWDRPFPGPPGRPCRRRRRHWRLQPRRLRRGPRQTRSRRRRSGIRRGRRRPCEPPSAAGRATHGPSSRRRRCVFSDEASRPSLRSPQDGFGGVVLREADARRVDRRVDEGTPRGVKLVSGVPDTLPPCAPRFTCPRLRRCLPDGTRREVAHLVFGQLPVDFLHRLERGGQGRAGSVFLSESKGDPVADDAEFVTRVVVRNGSVEVDDVHPYDDRGGGVLQRHRRVVQDRAGGVKVGQGARVREPALLLPDS